MATEKGKLLIIDDEDRLRMLLARILQLEGYEVEGWGDARQNGTPGHSHSIVHSPVTI